MADITHMTASYISEKQISSLEAMYMHAPVVFMTGAVLLALLFLTYKTITSSNISKAVVETLTHVQHTDKLVEDIRNDQIVSTEERRQQALHIIDIDRRLTSLECALVEHKSICKNFHTNIPKKGDES